MKEVTRGGLEPRAEFFLVGISRRGFEGSTDVDIASPKVAEESGRAPIARMEYLREGATTGKKVGGSASAKRVPTDGP